MEYLNNIESTRLLDLDSYHNSSDCKLRDIKMLIETSPNEKYMNTLNFDCFPKSVDKFQDSPEVFQQIIFIDYQLQSLIQRQLKNLSIIECRDSISKNSGSLRESLTSLIRFAESLENYHDIPNTSHEEKLYYAVIMTHLYYLNSQTEELIRTNEKFESSIPSTLHSSAYIHNDFVEYLACRQIVLLGLSDEQSRYKLWAEYLISLKKPFTKSNIAASHWLDVLFGGMALLLSSQDKKLITFDSDIKAQIFAKNNLMLVLFSNYLMKIENRHFLDADFRAQFSNYLKIHIESIIKNENHFPDASSENHDLNFFVYNLYESLSYVPMKYHILSGLLSKKLLINLTQKSYQSQIILRTLIKTLIDREEYDEAYAAFKTYISYIEKDQEQHNGYIHDILSIIDTYATCILRFNPLDSLSLQSNDSKKFKYVTRDQILHSLDKCAVESKGYLRELANTCDLKYDDSPNDNHISFLYLKYNDNVMQEDNSYFIRLISKSWYSLGYYYYYLCSFELPNYETIDAYTSKVLKYYKNSLIIDTTGNISYLFNYALILSYNRSIQQAIKLCKFILKRHPESFKTWNLYALLLSSLETHSSGDNAQNQKHTYQVNVTIDGSINDTMSGGANGTAASNIQMTKIRELEKIINNGLNIAGIYLVKNRKSNLNLTNETKFDILQLKLTQLSIWESTYGTHYILEYLSEVFVLYNELFDIDIGTNKSDNTQLRTNIAKWSHRPSFIDPSSNQNNDIKQENHLSKEKKLAKDKIKRMSKISKSKERHDYQTNGTSMKKLNVTERKILQDIWVWASKIYLKIGLLEEAEQCIVEAESIHEPNTKTITSLGLICSSNRKFLALQEFERSLEILNEPINYYKKRELGTTLLGLCKLIILDDNIDNSLFISTKDLSSGLIRLKNYLEQFSQSWPFGYNNSEIWWYLSLIYEKIDDKVMLTKSLWKCVELEDFRPVRDFDCCSEFIP